MFEPLGLAELIQPKLILKFILTVLLAYKTYAYKILTKIAILSKKKTNSYFVFYSLILVINKMFTVKRLFSVP